MVKVTIGRLDLEQPANQPVHRVLAEVVIDGHEVVVKGDGRYFDTTVPVVDPDTRQRLTFDEDPERWARNLQHAYRSGDLAFDVEEVPVPAGAHDRRRH